MVLLNYQPPMTPYLTLLYRDEDVLVLAKPNGLLSVKGRAEQHFDSLQTRTQRVFPTASVVHRLDMATSGIILMALNKAANRELSRQFQQRLVNKRYIARVYGHPEQEQGVIELPLICDWPNRPKQMVDRENGKPSTTHYQVLTRDTYSTLVELKPITGRSHQLRVHMQAIGHPILGDRLYAHDDALRVSDRLLLHAESIEFSHPASGEPMRFELPHSFADEPDSALHHQHQAFIQVNHP
ncbi:bifunctional tRNA pseudouridine(32) synthase/23S rRNA pseudouridine(746) synthase RluA [Alteromonas sp. ASW11-36]|uniref:Pseudouridine synthase n=1 Tax=Alteromonas arenosi TaxID=3055817 RepID=A0ABT7SZR0_9ALTE|nr:bifunctional tRNA pseudouridine(32) synthase/23S rRNA pseudouridine(746) synthase RluA [Alteromonas sp. ASW11-36]MDM7861686.1 bifunctional tRNA pseudouridine(32) synthase/23S rRNA pseudouridine(746) synthase RluA [Alteromonas sp. ASW11-36]